MCFTVFMPPWVFFGELEKTVAVALPLRTMYQRFYIVVKSAIGAERVE
jgi:hypothetical protein